MLKGKPFLNLVLAPMEGVTDAPMRALLTEVGDFDFCVSEFLRISQSLLPDKVFLKHVPELNTQGRTPSGTKVLVQLLGGDPVLLAKSASQACELGALGIDLNFGCPAPTVNRHDGGATLLKYPERIENIVAAVRAAVPPTLPVSAKLRLGWDHKEAIFENAKRAQNGGASWITVHARTKMQGYAPPADWEILGSVIKNLKIPVIVNGDLWTREDLLEALKVTDSNSFMLGRGTLADPYLSLRLKGKGDPKINWRELLTTFQRVSEPYGFPSGYFVRRMKQWLRLATTKGNFENWEVIKKIETLEGMENVLN